jgi:V/A-type H+-transporting ATPase subunit D
MIRGGKMNPNDTPTKQNLHLARLGLHTAKQGYDLMDKKRLILLAELRETKRYLHDIGLQVSRDVVKACKALETARNEMGAEAVNQIRAKGYYNLSGTTASLDEACFTWLEAKKTLAKFIDAHKKVDDLLLSIKKTQKRAAAFEKILIPEYVTRIKYIQSQLEERSRDEMIRTRKVYVRNKDKRNV